MFINNPVTANIGGGYKAKLSIDQAITNECNKTQPDTKKTHEASSGQLVKFTISGEILSDESKEKFLEKKRTRVEICS